MKRVAMYINMKILKVKKMMGRWGIMLAVNLPQKMMGRWGIILAVNLPQANTDFRSVRGENVSMVEALENAYGREKHEGMASLGELHGKLATADLRAKARKCM
ncbi:unnamed protein product [Gongylonema pulchrum]|uniref:Reverse transcriptase domain-containing protein n=1 Tax=Gongylonema pulchrum TaxID=637853 RepID=A0A183ENZ5_9BILA|nr:unnamed protein product [Gongylonema pulchrum]